MFNSYNFSEPRVPYIPYHDELKEIFSSEQCTNLNWNSAAATFPLFVRLVDFNDYRYNVTLGLVCSIGGLTETLVNLVRFFVFRYVSLLFFID